MPKRPVFLLAAGGHGAVVLDVMLRCGMVVAGIVDPQKVCGQTVFTVPVLGGDKYLDRYDPGEILLANGVGSIPGSNLRQQLFESWRKRGFEFVSIRHPTVVVGQDVGLKEGSQAMAGSVLQCRAEIGENVIVNTRASIDHDCRVGAHAFVGPGAIVCGGVMVGESAFIGAGAVLLPGISVGAGAIVSAGAIVTCDVSSRVMVAGNPAVEKESKRI